MSSLAICKLPVPLLNLIYCVAVPTLNSWTPSLFAIQTPALVLSLNEYLPLLIIPVVALPVNCKFFVSSEPTLIKPFWFAWSPIISIVLCPNDIEECSEEICTSPSPASNSNLDEVICTWLEANFIALVESPTWNSEFALLFAIQKPSVKESTESLPLDIEPLAWLPNISICLFEVPPTRIFALLPSFFNNISPSANDIDVLPLDICKSPLPASTSNLSVLISPLDDMKLPAESPTLKLPVVYQ